MTGTHRPLSEWVARIDPVPTVPTVGTNPINDGDERADARRLPSSRTAGRGAR
ncbi:hypothetical protein ABMX48_14810 [Streptomyces cavourensis]